jgi:flagellar motility protein MotE (MotC chaperone)
MKRMRLVVKMALPRRARSFRHDAEKIIAAALIVWFTGAVISMPASAGSAPKAAATEKSSAAAPKPLAELQPSGPLATQYCVAVRDAIAEARYAQQTAQLERLAKEAEDRLTLIDKRSAELKEWITKRDNFIAAATKHLVAIFGAMRPESASAQLVRLDIPTAAAILSQLDVRAASAILNDMPPEKAARLTAVIAGSARKDGQENP